MRVNPTRTLRVPYAAALAAGLGACGAGTAGVVASATGDDGGGGTAPALAMVATHLASSPAALVLEANRAMRVRLFFDPDGAGLRRMQHLNGPGVSGNEVLLAAGGNPPLHWDFPQDLGTSALVEDVRIVALDQGDREVTGGDIERDLGNDPPEIIVDAQGFVVGSVPPSESAKRARVTFVVRDSSRQAVRLRVEFARADGLDVDAGELPPDEAFSPATPDGLVPDLIAAVGGTSADFTWNCGADLATEEHDVVLRIVPTDLDDDGNPLAEGVARPTRVFRVDDNTEPRVSFEAPAPAEPDERRGIRVGFRVLDDESDAVQVVLQWRHAGASFPVLPLEDSAAMDAILGDPASRRLLQVCAPYPRVARGRLEPRDATSARLPELGAAESWLLAGGLVGETLDVLRPGSAPQSAGLAAAGLLAPVGAEPVGDGTRALVLDGDGAAGWRLREVDLARGVATPVAAGGGTPRALCLERGGAAALVACGEATRILRVELSGGAVSQLVDDALGGPVRAVESTGARALLFSAGSSVSHCDYREPVARVAQVLTGLDGPYGIALDARDPDRFYVAEQGADRVLAADVRERNRVPVVARTALALPDPLRSPTALALERNGARLLVVARAAGGGRELRALELGAAGGNVASTVGPLPDDALASLATGPDGLRLLALPSRDELFLSGGLEQQRTIAALDPQAPAAPCEQRVLVDPPFDPVPTAGRTWRISLARAVASHAAVPLGTAGSFLWDARAAEGRPTFLRAFARDGEFGPVTEDPTERTVLSAFDVPSVAASGAVALDLDGDGDLDLVSSVGTGWIQSGPRVFEPRSLGLGASTCVASGDLAPAGAPELVTAHEAEDLLRIHRRLPDGTFAPSGMLGGPGEIDGPVAVVVADLDSDGAMDVACANRAGDDLATFRWTSGGFASASVGGASLTDGPRALAVGDLDGDGDVDLASANADGDDLTVFFQSAAGAFPDPPAVLGGGATTAAPRAVIVFDVDADGDLDVASANAGGDDLAVFAQGSPGDFSAAPIEVGGILHTRGPTVLAAADLDADGDADLVCGNAEGDDVTVFRQLAPGVFPDAPTRLPVRPASDHSLLLEDIDGSGDTDVVAEAILFQHASGAFAPAPTAVGTTAPEPDGPLSLACADLDDDGDLDLVTANREGGDLSVFEQLAPRAFSAATRVGGASTLGASSVAAGDIDGDGRPDLVSANYDGHDLALFFRRGSTFAKPPRSLGGFPDTIHPGTVALADLDANGHLDVVSCNELFGDDLALFHQDGFAQFEPTSLRIGASLLDLPSALAIDDVDQDGHLDLVVANEFGNRLTLFRRDGPRSYSASDVGGPAVTRAPLSVASADVDGDGDRDLVSANGDGNDLAVFLRGPLGYASAPVRLGGFPTTIRPEAVVAADVDGDGDLDLVSGNHFTNELAVFAQETPGRFIGAPTLLGGFATTARPASVSVLDVDGDGDVDVVSANANGDDVAVFFGGR